MPPQGGRAPRKGSRALRKGGRPFRKGGEAVRRSHRCRKASGLLARAGGAPQGVPQPPARVASPPQGGRCDRVVGPFGRFHARRTWRRPALPDVDSTAMVSARRRRARSRPSRSPCPTRHRPPRPAIRLAGVRFSFHDRRSHGPRPRRDRPRDRAAVGRRARRPERLRQEHAAAGHRRAAPGAGGTRRGRGAARRRARSPRRPRLPGAAPPAVADRARERRVPARGRRSRAGGPRGAGAGPAGAGRPARLGRSPAGRAVGRHAPAASRSRGRWPSSRRSCSSTSRSARSTRSPGSASTSSSSGSGSGSGRRSCSSPTHPEAVFLADRVLVLSPRPAQSWRPTWPWTCRGPDGSATSTRPSSPARPPRSGPTSAGATDDAFAVALGDVAAHAEPDEAHRVSDREGGSSCRSSPSSASWSTGRLIVWIGSYPTFILPGPARRRPALRRGLGRRHDGAAPASTTLAGDRGRLRRWAPARHCSTGYVLARSRLANRVLSPYLVAAQAVPILALAPLIALWFGSGPGRRARSSSPSIVFFPVAISTMVAVRGVDRRLLEMARSYRVTRAPARSGWWSSRPRCPASWAASGSGSRWRSSARSWPNGPAASTGLGVLINLARGSLFDIPLLFATLLTIALHRHRALRQRPARGAPASSRRS